MNYLNHFNRILRILLLAGICVFAEITPETKGMQDTRFDGTFLTASPTFVYDRNSQMGGIHSESEEWTPSKMRYRMLVNRLSATPLWDVQDPSVWLSVGNEIGDMMYQDARVGGWNQAAPNRTPMQEVGFRSKSYDGIWTTARYFQVDHYSVKSRAERERMVGTTSYSLFGENLPFFSTMYAGLGYSASSFEVLALAGHEYIWEMGESGRWIPVELKPRAETRFDSRYFHANLVFENGEYTLLKNKTVGNRKEISGSVKIGEDSLLQSFRLWNLALGAAFRAVDDSGAVPFGIRDDYVVFPFLEISLRPAKRLTLAGFIGTSGREFAGKDSVNLELPASAWVRTNVGLKNHVASTLNPLGEDYEYYNTDTIHLRTDGVMQLHRLYMDLRTRVNLFEFGVNVAGWIEKGAETFGIDEKEPRGAGKNPYVYRTGDVDRIDSWIRGVSGEALLAYRYEKIFSLLARAGLERIDGDEERFEVNPAEEWVSIGAEWNLWDYFWIQHSWSYRSDARWNLRSENPFVVKGSWYWDASFTQNFPKYGLSLSATLVHSLGKNLVQVPNGGEDVTRFFCNIVKKF